MSYFLTAGLLVLPLIRLSKNIQNTTKYFCTIPWLLANSFETFILNFIKMNYVNPMFLMCLCGK